MNTIKGKISNVVDAVTEKVSGGHDSVHTATKTPPAAPAGATHPVPGDRSINGATDHGSIKTVPPTVNGDKSAKERLEEKVKEPTPSKTLATPSQTLRTTSETVTPSTTAAKVKTAPVETVPVVAVEAPATAKAEAVLPAKAVKPVADATVPVTKFSEAEAYAVLPPAGAVAGETKSTLAFPTPVVPVVHSRTMAPPTAAPRPPPAAFVPPAAAAATPTAAAATTTTTTTAAATAAAGRCVRRHPPRPPVGGAGVALSTPVRRRRAAVGGGGDDHGDGDGLLARLQAKAAATYEALDGGQQAYVQALYVALVVSAFVSASAAMVRLYRAWGLPPFG